MARSQQNWGAFVLQIIGSLVFLGVIFSGALSVSGGVFTGVGAFWAPLFVGAAVIAAIALFFASFGYVTGMNWPNISLFGLETAAVAGIMLVALTWGNQPWLWATLLGFVLSFIGAGMAKK